VYIRSTRFGPDGSWFIIYTTVPTNNIRDWQSNREMWVSMLEKQTGLGLDTWNSRIKEERLGDENSLRNWLAQHGVTGYAQQLLVMERFGYPDFLTTTADELVAAQYADRLHLRPVYDEIIKGVMGFGEVILQARKTYVSLVTTRRTFARIVPSTKKRVELGLRLDGQKPVGRLLPSHIHDTMRLQFTLSQPDEVDVEVLNWLKKAYDQSC